MSGFVQMLVGRCDCRVPAAPWVSPGLMLGSRAGCGRNTAGPSGGEGCRFCVCVHRVCACQFTGVLSTQPWKDFVRVHKHIVTSGTADSHPCSVCWAQWH